MNGSHSFEGSILLLFKIIALIVFTTCKILKLLSFKVGGGGPCKEELVPSPASEWVGGTSYHSQPPDPSGTIKIQGTSRDGQFFHDPLRDRK